MHVNERSMNTLSLCADCKRYEISSPSTPSSWTTTPVCVAKYSLDTWNTNLNMVISGAP